MVSKITSKEVLLYLNYLGYESINAQQLKEFIQDLKKLIKYEEKKKLRKTDLSYYHPVESNKSTKFEYIFKNTHEEPKRDVFDYLHFQETCASKTRKESVITLAISRNRQNHRCLNEHKDLLTKSCDKEDNKLSDQKQIPVKEVSQSETNVIKDKQEQPKNKRSKSSFIRPPMQSTNKSDPVALYHKYKAEWQRHKIPGEDQRTDLRWALRQKMLGRH